MTERRKSKKRKEEAFTDEDQPESKASKDEYKVAKWLKKNVAHKKTKFMYHNVEYFTGAKAVDALLESQWGKPQNEGEEAFFKSRTDIVKFLDLMLRHKFFHRAKKVPVSEQELLARKKKKKKDGKEEGKEKEKEGGTAGEEAESSHAEGKIEEKTENKDGKERKKRKIRLEMHYDQLFADGLDAYVWIYDPIPVHYWLFGTLMVLGAIGVCLFPLWPPEVRKGVYYLSLLGAGFLCLIIALTVLRLLVFCLLWTITLGKHHFWLLPNLTEDVGFVASFWPLYQYEYKGDAGKNKKKKKKEKDSDNEEENDNDNENNEENDDNDNEDVEKTEDSDKVIESQKKQGEGDKTSEGERNSPSESESESSSQKSQTGRDFEIVDRAEVEGRS